MVPTDIDPSGRVEERNHAPSKCLATLSHEAGRLDISGLSLENAASAFARRNREIIDEIKRCLWQEMNQNLLHFDIGNRLTEEADFLSIDEIGQRLAPLSRDFCRTHHAYDALSIFSQEKRLAVSLKILKHRATGGTFACGDEKPLRLAASVISHRDAQPYYEASLETLNAAFHLVLLDAGGNVQPIEDLPFEAFVGRARRGKQELRSSKNRATKKKSIHPPLYVTTKGSLGCPSGVEVVESWKKLTATMREASGPTAVRLWLWRKPGTMKVGISNIALNDRWKAFLRRHSDNPLFGNLPITRQILRTAIANSRLEEGNFDLRIVRAILGHSAESTTFEYMSQGGIRAVLNQLILRFLNEWEAVAALGIDDAAKYLGISEPDLLNRRQLGFENGLAFAAASETAPLREPVTSDEAPTLLAEHAKTFAVTRESLITLELARRALHAQMERLLNTNPARFLRKWVTWLAIIEGYCQKLQETGHRVTFRKAREFVEDGLSSGRIALPVLW
jgi:hypothetical protein